MGGDDGDKWFVAGGRSRARKRQDATTSRGGTSVVGAGAGTSRGGGKKCFNCRGVGHLQHQCPLKVSTTSSRGKQTAGSHYGSSSNVSTAASTSSGGNRRLPPPKKHPKAGPSSGGGQPGSQAASTSGATTAGCKRARDPTSTSGFTPPNKQATGSTRFSYAEAVEGGERVVLVRVLPFTLKCLITLVRGRRRRRGSGGRGEIDLLLENNCTAISVDTFFNLH